jgi:acetolactate synthase-1/2/3 large subunit
MATTAADVLCATLARRGTTHVFGIPGSETIELWDALRRSSALTSVVPTNELTGSFMAIGHARASGRPGVLSTIGGPGFTYALTGLAEALLDSVPLVHVAALPTRREDGGPGLQWISQHEIAGPLVKAIIDIPEPGATADAVDEAFDVAMSGEPGPVLLQYEPATLAGRSRGGSRTEDPTQQAPPAPDVGEVVSRLLAAQRPVLLCGLGASRAAASVTRLAESLGAPVLTTTSGRGVVSERHRLSLVHDAPGATTAVLDELLGDADLVLCVGCKLSHNGSRGFRLRLPPETLVRVDASADAMGPPYPASLELVADAGPFLAVVAEQVAAGTAASTWTDETVADVRRRLADASSPLTEPTVAGGTPERLFAALRDALPDDAVVTADSGLHQFLLRAHFPVLAPGTLVVPANYQSMGFGIPAAIGAALATGERTVAVVGDGGLNIAGFELLTAVRAGARVTVVVLVDRHFGLIRAQQLRRAGNAFGVDIPVADLRLLAESLGAAHVLVDDVEGDDLGRALDAADVVLVEVPTEAPEPTARDRARNLGVSLARTTVGPGALGEVYDALRPRRTR